MYILLVLFLRRTLTDTLVNKIKRQRLRQSLFVNTENHVQTRDYFPPSLQENGVFALHCWVLKAKKITHHIILKILKKENCHMSVCDGLSNRTFCDGGNVLFLHCPKQWPLAPYSCRALER